MTTLATENELTEDHILADAEALANLVFEAPTETDFADAEASVRANGCPFDHPSQGGGAA